jgi:hypothetical protein
MSRPRSSKPGADVQDCDYIKLASEAPSRSLTELIERITPENLHDSLFDDLASAERW